MSPGPMRRRSTRVPLTYVPFVDPESTIHQAPPSTSASAWRALDAGDSDSVRRRVLSRLRPMRTRGPEKISSSPRRGPLRYRNRRGCTLLLADGVLCCGLAGELDHRELVLHLDDRARADLFFTGAELRTGVRIDPCFAHVDDV